MERARSISPKSDWTPRRDFDIANLGPRDATRFQRVPSRTKTKRRTPKKQIRDCRRWIQKAGKARHNVPRDRLFFDIFFSAAMRSISISPRVELNHRKKNS
ncbi:hypothetical protein AWENTII_012316 [Aspergillus wentii]